MDLKESIQKKAEDAKLKAASLKEKADLKGLFGKIAGKSKVPTAKNSKVAGALYSIRNKIILCFLIPIVFMVIIGLVAYNKASDGMQEKFMESTGQTIYMAMEKIDLNNSFIAQQAYTYAYDKDLGSYFLGLSEASETADILKKTRSSLATIQKSNPSIMNIIINTGSDLQALTTVAHDSGTLVYGNFEDYVASTPMEGKKLKPWIDSHEVLDSHLGLKADDSIISYQTYSEKKTAAIIFDISSAYIEDSLKEIDLGEGSIIGFVTENGREVISENIKEGGKSALKEGQAVFYGQDFYNEIIPADTQGEETEESEAVMRGSSEIKYLGEKYLFIYSRSSVCGATLCALVPKDIVTSQAESIKVVTISLVILASLIAGLFGLFIAYGIQRNMKRIGKSLGEVEKGDLTVKVKATGRDEFSDLAFAANNMIANNKRLVTQVNNATQDLEASAGDVKDAAEIIDSYSHQISDVVGTINQGMERQSRHANDCVDKTKQLSEEIKGINNTMSSVESLVVDTEKMINEGMEKVSFLGERAQDTNEITTEVGNSIEKLRKETEQINDFVTMISDIAGQTNLLSLNASIEAARAGDAGRGFSVVAEEIRKLADQSKNAAKEIQNNVEKITGHTQETVSSAHKAVEMVAAQTQAVDEVVAIFHKMNEQMGEVVKSLQDIVSNTERADMLRGETLKTVRNMSQIIDDSAAGASAVNEVIDELIQNVGNLNKVSENLDRNMEGLKTEISAFKTE
ncbi:MAG: methyl-accepting chemotaxis protein [Lachnospiraceae bacterium]|nr:methyl-accepting chemotaxis protein [Lachnospiraceae bacterium]